MPVNERTGLEAQPISSVFAGERETPHAVFQRSRTENAGAVANHRANDLALSCPRCQEESRMFSRPDAGYYCLNGHKWLDYEELMALNPKPLKFRGTPARQEGFVKLPVDIPGAISELLTKKYGDRLTATIANVLTVLASGKFLVLNEEDLKQIAIHTGEEIRNPATLVGKLYELKQRAAETEESNKNLRASLNGGGRGPVFSDSTVIVDVGEELMPQLAEKASSKGMSAVAYVKEAARLAVEGDWVS